MVLNTHNAARELIRSALFLMKDPTTENYLVALRLAAIALRLDKDTGVFTEFVQLCVAFSKHKDFIAGQLMGPLSREMHELLKELA